MPSGAGKKDPPVDRPPYAAAAAVAALVLAGYIGTLAPTVTFWDAGEFIAAAKTLGIPHPPGTPLFVLLAHVWAKLIPIGEYAFRTNLLSAACSAGAAGLLFLLAHHVVARVRDPVAGVRDPGAPRWLLLAGPAAAAVAGAFTFTHWQNSNETEVYAVSTFLVAAMMWLAVLWRRDRASTRAPRHLLLLVYLAGLSIGAHLLALLAVPGVLLLLIATLRSEPAADPARRRREWGAVAVVAGIWALLVGTGLGSTALTAVGGLCFVAAAGYATAGGAGAFAALSLVVAAVGVTPYLFMFLRAAQHPPINEAAPATLEALLDVIRRTQYPVRTPLDDPTVPHGAGNPGRSLLILGVQLADYFLYFTWQWAKAVRLFEARVLAAIVFLGLGTRGLIAHRRADRGTWWMVLGVFLVTGLGLVLYMNFKPGYDRWFDLFPGGAQHEVRERDYFFVISFVLWGWWAGLGLAGLAQGMSRRAVRGRRVLAPAVLALALLPAALNWTAASRRSGPDARLAADLAYNLLQSVPPYGILFTYGDNDTFPLWWAQEVEGIRQDVTVVCLALANTDWYMRQLRDTPPRRLDAAALPAVWKDRVIPRPTHPIHALDDSAIAAAQAGFIASEPRRVQVGPLTRAVAPGSFLYPNEIVALSVLQLNLGRRPIVWSVTTGHDFAGFGDYVVQRGLGFELLPGRPENILPPHDLGTLAGGPPIDVPTTEALLWATYRYRRLLDHESVLSLESTSAAFATTLALPYTQLAYLYRERGEREKLARAVERATRLSPRADMRAALAELESGTPSPQRFPSP